MLHAGKEVDNPFILNPSAFAFWGSQPVFNFDHYFDKQEIQPLYLKLSPSFIGRQSNEPPAMPKSPLVKPLEIHRATIDFMPDAR
jgi:hypothetical protein